MTQNADGGPKDYDAIAARYLDLWQEQIAKLAKDPQQLTDAAAAWSNAAASMMRSAAANMGQSASQGSSDEPGSADTENGAAPAGPAHGDGGLDLADVVRRLDAIERRLAALESGVEPKRSRSTSGSRRAAKNPDQIGAAWDQYLDPVAFLNSITRQSKERMETFVAGVKAYQAHAYRRELEAPAPVWRNGSARLIDYAPNGGGRPVLFVPSLINRAYILDLAEDRSLMRAAAAAGLHPFLLDWGAPNEAEKQFAVEDYVEGILIPALEEVQDRCGRAPALVGYCMGGTLCVAPAVLRPELVDRLVLLAAPWDFHARSEASRMLIGLSRPALEVMLEAEGAASVDLLQALFASLDPTLVGRKFRNFANLDPMSEQARRFVELEDWLNDGVPLAGPVAREVIFNWYGDNAPAGKKWMIGRNVIDPARISCPTIAFIPGQDRIVPPDSARKLAAEIPNAEVFDINLGHIGMISGGSAPKRVYEPLIQWLKPDE